MLREPRVRPRRFGRPEASSIKPRERLCLGRARAPHVSPPSARAEVPTSPPRMSCYSSPEAGGHTLLQHSVFPFTGWTVPTHTPPTDTVDRKALRTSLLSRSNSPTNLERRRVWRALCARRCASSYAVRSALRAASRVRPHNSRPLHSAVRHTLAALCIRGRESPAVGVAFRKQRFGKKNCEPVDCCARSLSLRERSQGPVSHLAL